MQEIAELKPQLQVFVCTRTKSEGACCGPKGAMGLREELKTWVKNQGLQKFVKVTASLCLGQCEKGITVCIYPDNAWYVQVSAEQDLEGLKQTILERLQNRSSAPTLS